MSDGLKQQHSFTRWTIEIEHRALQETLCVNLNRPVLLKLVQKCENCADVVIRF